MMSGWCTEFVGVVLPLRENYSDQGDQCRESIKHPPLEEPAEESSVLVLMLEFCPPAVPTMADTSLDMLLSSSLYIAVTTK